MSESLKKNYLNKSKIKFSSPNDKIIKYVNSTPTNERFYKQIFGLLMGSPLSWILACLIVEIDDLNKIQNKLSPTRYISDISVSPYYSLYIKKKYRK